MDSKLLPTSSFSEFLKHNPLINNCYFLFLKQKYFVVPRNIVLLLAFLVLYPALLLKIFY